MFLFFFSCVFVAAAFSSAAAVFFCPSSAQSFRVVGSDLLPCRLSRGGSAATIFLDESDPDSWNPLLHMLLMGKITPFRILSGAMNRYIIHTYIHICIHVP